MFVVELVLLYFLSACISFNSSVLSAIKVSYDTNLGSK